MTVRRRHTNRNFEASEQLECRALLSGISLSNGVLSVNGTGQANYIVIEQTNSNVEVTLDNEFERFSNSSVDRVVVKARGGNDTIQVINFSGPTLLDGNGGKDTIIGGSGPDSILGGSGNDSLVGNDGADFINGGGGQDVISGLRGTDTLRGSGGNDTVLGGDSNDSLFGDAGADVIEGGNGKDDLWRLRERQHRWWECPRPDLWRKR